MINSFSVFTLIWLMLIPGSSSKVTIHHTSLTETISSEAKPHFKKGLLLLHNFEYYDAAEQFVLAQQKDPGFVLSYWGEAMTYDHPIWAELDIEKSRTALNKIAPSPSERVEKGKTELEKDFIQSLNILFGEGSKPDREKAYSQYMAGLYNKYADNNDVAAFYALSLLTTKKGWSEWEENNIKAAEITQKILDNDPDHAGALHYMVHADDHPQHARDGLAAADRYAKVASYAGHALHMPSHIYLALGMWDDVVRANEVSWKASVDRKTSKGLDNDHLSYHSHMWLMYGYIQQGRFQQAKTILDNQVKFTNELPSREARIHLMEMRGHYLFNVEDWSSPLAELPIKDDDVYVSAQFVNKFVTGYRLFRSNNSEELRKLITEFESSLANAKQLQKAGAGIPICGADGYALSTPTEKQIGSGGRRLNQLKAMEAWLRNDMAAAEGFIKESLPKDGTVVVGPPAVVLLPHELYGQFLLANNRPAEAIQQFDKALSMSPNRYVSLKGKLSAVRALKDSKSESALIAQLKQNLKSADPAASKGLW